MTLGQVLAELRTYGLVLTSAEIAHEQVSRFTVVQAHAEETTSPETPDALERFIRRKEPKA